MKINKDKQLAENLAQELLDRGYIQREHFNGVMEVINDFLYNSDAVKIQVL